MIKTATIKCTIFVEMQKRIKIKASLLLGIFSLLILHQIVPHQHHDHESQNEVAHNHEAVVHGHNHDHDDNHKKESTKSLLLDFFLEIHSHGNSNASYTYANTIIKKQKSVDLNVLKAKIEVEYIAIVDYQLISKILYASVITPYNASLVRPELRGPPLLG